MSTILTLYSYVLVPREIILSNLNLTF